VDRPRDQLLAGAALALDQYRHVGGRDGLDQRLHLRQGGALADHERGRVLLRLQALAAELVVTAQRGGVQGAVDHDQQLFRADRLDQVLERARLHRLDRVAHRAEAGQHDHRLVLAEAGQAAQVCRRPGDERR